MRTALLTLVMLLATAAGCAATPSGPADPLASSRFKEVGWAAGAANNDDPARTAFFAITSVEQAPGRTHITYAWKHGRMNLQAQTIQNLDVQGQVLSGTWVQDNASGPIEFTFDMDGRFLSGRWNDATNSKWFPAFLK